MVRKNKKSPCNVFKDLGFENADEMLAKAKLVYKINQCIDKRHLTQAEVSQILLIPQSKVSLLLNGKIYGFSVEMLMHFLNRLSFDVEISIKPLRQSCLGQIRIHA